jgi:MoaA/NifB/PqqE/SkfB family radical SAM enzyme
MRTHELKRGLLRSPRLLLDALARGRYEFVYDRMPVRVSGMTWGKRLNLALAGTHMLRRQLRPGNMPLHMQFELTSYCNLKCPACPTGAGELDRGAQAMTPAMFERVWEEAAPYLLTASLWGWGEPLLHPRLGEILRVARRHRVATFLSTNGVPLRQESVREALVEYPVTTLIVAIDGLTDATNQQLRIGARLEPILEGVRKLAALKRQRNARYPVLQMRYIVTRHNEHEVEQVEAFARENEFELLTIRALSIFDLSQAEAVREGFVPLNELLQACPREDTPLAPRDGFVCMNPFWFPSLLAGGEVVACEQDHSARFALGTVTPARGFRKIWFSREAAEVRRLVRDEHPSLSFCRNCPYPGRATSDCSLESRQLAPDALYPGLVAGAER